MKKQLSLLVALSMVLILLTGCGKKDYLAEESTLYILKNGSVIATDVEAFPADTYNLEGLETFVKNTIDEYNAEHEKDSVSLYSISATDGICTLSIKYKTVEDFNAFTGYDLFVGSIAEALAAGYTFDSEYASIDGDTASACKASAFLDATSYSVVLFNEAYNIHVYGNVAFTSVYNTSIVDKNTISFAFGNTLNGVEAVESTEIASEVTETVEDTQIPDSASDGAVGEDEFEISTEEEVVYFEFDEETAPSIKPEIGTVTVIFRK